MILIIGELLLIAINIYTWIVVISAVMTFIEPNPYNKIVQTLHKLTQPAYDFIRRYIPTTFNGIDLAPIILLLGLHLLKSIVLNAMYT